jgi:hypothetical protein
MGFEPLDISKVGLYGEPAWIAEASHSRCRPRTLPPPPPPPQPLALEDGFEATQLGGHPAKAQVSGEEVGASIQVTAERAATGKHSLKITDSKNLKPAWQPHFFYQPHITSGRVRHAFDLWLGKGVEFFTEWRDTAEYPRNVGPSVRFTTGGESVVQGKTLASIPLEQWVHVELESVLGNGARGVFTLTLTVPGQEPQTFRDLRFAGERFAELQWCGFSSTAAADVAFYLDNITIKQVK